MLALNVTFHQRHRSDARGQRLATGGACAGRRGFLKEARSPSCEPHRLPEQLDHLLSRTRDLPPATRRARIPLRCASRRITGDWSRHTRAPKWCPPLSPTPLGVLLQPDSAGRGLSRQPRAAIDVSQSSRNHSPALQWHRSPSAGDSGDSHGHSGWPMVIDACPWSLAHARCHSAVAPRAVQRDARRVPVRLMPLAAVSHPSLSSRRAMNNRDSRPFAPRFQQSCSPRN